MSTATHHDNRPEAIMPPGRVAPATGVALIAGLLAMIVVVPVVQVMEGQALPGRSGRSLPRVDLAPVPDAWRETSGPWHQRLFAANSRLLASLQAFETALEDESWLARELRAPAQWFLTRALGAGNEQAYPGRGNWVFYRDDVDYVTGPGFLNPLHRAGGHGGLGAATATRAHDPIAAITAFNETLRAHGTTLLLLPVPTKPALHPEHFTAGATAPLQNPSFEELLTRLRAANVPVFDAAPVLMEHARNTGTPAYLAGDTHWRPEAMQAVAKSLATEINALGLLPAVPATGYTRGQHTIASFGDTTAMLGLPPWQQRYTRESVPLAPVYDAAGNPWRRTPGADVILLGDSFANIFSQPSMGWGAAAGLAEQLAFELQRPLDRIVQNDNGAHATREALLQRLSTQPKDTPPPRLVIWEFTQRELALGDWR